MSTCASRQLDAPRSVKSSRRGTNAALMSSGTETLFGLSTTVVSALKVASPNGFVAHDNGYAGQASDCYVDLAADRVLNN